MLFTLTSKSNGGVPFLPNHSYDEKVILQSKDLPQPSKSKGRVPFLTGHINDEKVILKPKGLPLKNKSKGGVPFLTGNSNDEKLILKPKDLPQSSKSKGGLPFLPGQSNDEKILLKPRGLPPPIKSIPVLPGHSDDVINQPKGLPPQSKTKIGVPFLPGHSNDENILLQPKCLPQASKSKGVNILPWRFQQNFLIQPDEEEVNYSLGNSKNEKMKEKKNIPEKNCIEKDAYVSVDNDVYFQNFLQKDFMHLSDMTLHGVDFNCVIMDYMFPIVVVS